MEQQIKRQRVDSYLPDETKLCALEQVLYFLDSTKFCTTSNLALVCTFLLKKVERFKEKKFRTNKCDVNLDNFTWFENVLGACRYDLCQAAAIVENLEYLENIVPTNTCDKFYRSAGSIAAKYDSLRLQDWLCKRECRERFALGACLLSLAVNDCLEHGAISIIEKYLSNDLITASGVKFHYRTIVWIREKRPEIFQTPGVLDRQINSNFEHHGSDEELELLFRCGKTGVNVNKLYAWAVSCDRRNAMCMLYGLSPHPERLKKLRYEGSRLETVELLSKQTGIECRRIVLAIPPEPELAIWLSQKQNQIEPRIYFHLIGKGKLDFEILDQYRKFSFTEIDSHTHIAICAPNISAKALEFLIQKGLPVCDMLFCVAFRILSLECCCYLLEKFPMYRNILERGFTWKIHPPHVMNSIENETKKMLWLREQKFLTWDHVETQIHRAVYYDNMDIFKVLLETLNPISVDILSGHILKREGSPKFIHELYLKTGEYSVRILTREFLHLEWTSEQLEPLIEVVAEDLKILGFRWPRSFDFWMRHREKFPNNKLTQEHCRLFWPLRDYTLYCEEIKSLL